MTLNYEIFKLKNTLATPQWIADASDYNHPDRKLYREADRREMREKLNTHLHQITQKLTDAT